jgi:hypothetical protein
MIHLLLPPLLAVAQIITGSQIEQSQPPPVTGTATIAGTVVNDATGEPIRKAQVSLFGAVGGKPPMAVTDASGAFAFHKLPAGAVTVQAAKDGFDQERGMIFGDNQKQVTVVADQNATGIDLRLAPMGAISGRLIDEVGDAAPYCQVSAVTADPPQQQRASVNSDDRGEYWLENLPAGRYLVYQHCHQTLAAPHPFMERDDPRTPALAWIPGFYGGADAGAGASAITVHEGEEVHGVDFRLKTANAFAVQIVVAPDDPDVDLRRVNVRLVPRDSTLAFLTQYGVGRANNSGPFRAAGVIPGSYTVVADFQEAERRWHGEAAVEVGDAPPELVRLPLMAAMTITGDVDFGHSDSAATATGPQGVVGDGPTEMIGRVGSQGMIALTPLDQSSGLPWAQAQISADGSFSIPGVVPGRYRLQVNGGSGGVQSATFGGREVAVQGFDIPQGAGGPLHVAVSRKQVELQVSVSGFEQGRTGWVFLLPKGSTPGGGGMSPPMVSLQTSPVSVSVPPGEYVAYAIECQQPWPVVNNATIFRAISDLGKPVEVKDGSNTAVSVDLIGQDTLKQALDKETR